MRKLLLTIFILILGALSVVLAWSWKPEVHPADPIHDAAAEAKGRLRAHQAIAQQRDPELEAARKEVLRLGVELKRLRSRLSLDGMASSAGESLASAPARDWAPLVDAQDQMIQAQDRRSILLEDQLGTKDAALTACVEASTLFELEAQSLRKDAGPRLVRAVGGIWNPGDHAYGVFVDQDIGRFRLGFDVVQQRLPVLAGGGVQVRAQFRAGIRF